MRNLKRPLQTPAQRENPDYPGINSLHKELRRKYPHISDLQATTMAAVQIRPDRNKNAVFIGWDQLSRPCFKLQDGSRIATMKNGNPTTVAGNIIKYDGE